MKKTILSLITIASVLLIAFAYNIQVGTLVATTECTTDAGVKCPTGTARTHCKTGESVNGTDGNCHCNTGLTRGSDGTCGGGASEDSGSGDDCSAIQSTYDDVNTQYSSSTMALSAAQSDLTTWSTAYQQALNASSTSVTAVPSFDNSTCIDSQATSPCGDDPTSSVSSTSATSTSGSCDDITAQCNQLFALTVSTNESACIIEGEAMLMKSSILATSTATTTTNGNNNNGTSTNSGITATSSATVFTVGITPSTIKQGETFTLSATISSSTVQTYSISATKDGTSLGNLLSNVSVGTSARPTNITQSFATASTIPTGTYTIKITNDQNINQFATINLIINAASASTASTIFNQNTSGNTSGSTSYNNGSSIIFLNPTMNSSQRIGSTMQIHWGYNAYISGTIDLYVQTVCSNGNSACTPTTALIAAAQPVGNIYYNWMVPAYIPANSWAILIAKQGGNVVGYSPTFIVTQ